jgi:biotin carboxyl carrier protein
MNEFYLHVKGEKFEVKFLNENSLMVNNKTETFSIQKCYSNSYNVLYRNKNFSCRILSVKNNQFTIFLNNSIYEVDCKTKMELIAQEIISKKNSGKDDNIKIYAPMPGLVLKILKEDGADVKKAEPVLILEAMKMENEILSPSDGKLKLSGIKEGQTIEKNTKLFEINNLLFEKKY